MIDAASGQRGGPRARPRGILRALGCVAALAVSACALPEHMEVRAGIDPRSQDDDVRFRTIYYFRVFDACPQSGRDKAGATPTGLFAKDNQGPYRIVLDSLYRFRMTGKANSLFSTVHFESGTLHKSEIDPFGANVVFDEKSGRFRFESREKTEAAAERDLKYAEIQRRIDLLTRLDKMVQTGDKKVLSVAARDEVTNVQAEIGKSIGGLIAKLDGAAPPRGETDSQAVVRCPDASAARRGFQILGPEGWRTFDQDERLILAMTSTGKPLINAMKEISGRILNEQPTRGEALLPLVQERLRIVRAEHVLDRLAAETDEPTAAGEAIGKVITEFDETQATGSNSQ